MGSSKLKTQFTYPSSYKSNEWVDVNLYLQWSEQVNPESNFVSAQAETQERALATVRRVTSISPIPDAHAIELVHVGLWQVVAKKNEYNIGRLVVYLEVDSWVPASLVPWLSRVDKEGVRHPRIFLGVPGERLRSIKLRKTLSQGLILSLEECGLKEPDVKEGDNVTQELGILKWERPLPAQLSGKVKGYFPPFLRKTDQERIQNVAEEMMVRDDMWEVTEKMDGSSMTVFIKDGSFGVCSRNLELIEEPGNAFWKTARAYDLENVLREEGLNIALQGELVGPGIQSNHYNLVEFKFLVFDIYDIDRQEYYTPDSRMEFIHTYGLQSVPLIKHDYKLPESPYSILEFADGQSMMGGLGIDIPREGLVFKSYTNPNISFKAISNEWLLGEKSD